MPPTRRNPSRQNASNLSCRRPLSCPLLLGVRTVPDNRSLGNADLHVFVDFKEKRMTELVVSGRHDCCFVQRTPVIVEAATAIVLADIL